MCFVLLLCQFTVENSIKSAPKCTISINKGHSPLPDTIPLLGRGTPPPQTLYPLVASGHSIVHRQLSPPPLADHCKHCVVSSDVAEKTAADVRLCHCAVVLLVQCRNFRHLCIITASDETIDSTFCMSSGINSKQFSGHN